MMHMIKLSMYGKKKIRSLHTIYLTYNISVPEMFNELKDVR